MKSNPSVYDLMDSLRTDRSDFVVNIRSKGVRTSPEDTLTLLSQKVKQIDGGAGGYNVFCSPTLPAVGQDGDICIVFRPESSIKDLDASAFTVNFYDRLFESAGNCYPRNSVTFFAEYKGELGVNVYDLDLGGMTIQCYILKSVVNSDGQLIADAYIWYSGEWLKGEYVKLPIGTREVLIASKLYNWFGPSNLPVIDYLLEDTASAVVDNKLNADASDVFSDEMLANFESAIAGLDISQSGVSELIDTYSLS